jgi:integrase
MSNVRIRFKGYAPERMKSGEIRHRVRVKGNAKKRMVIPVGPDDPTFTAHYHAAREGKKLEGAVSKKPMDGSLDELSSEYLAFLQAQVEADRASLLTLKQRRQLLTAACDVKAPEGDRMGSLDRDMPKAAILHILDSWGSKTGAADNCRKALSAMYRWAIDRDRLTNNPVVGIGRLHKSRGGAVPWKAEDLRKFVDRHPPGTTAYVWLVLTMFTGARRGDLAILGRQHENRHNGMIWLEWQPGKKGSAPMAVPMAPQLREATRAMTVQGPTFLLSAYGKPYASPDALGRKVEEWTAQAGLERRSSHGIRKALGTLLGELGCSELQIMSILAHTNPTTSSIYTKGAERRRMAASAMEVLEGVSLW